MADIPVKPRRATPPWLWLVLALVAAALVWFALSFLGDDEAGEADDAEEVEEVEETGGLPADVSAPLALATPPSSDWR